MNHSNNSKHASLPGALQQAGVSGNYSGARTFELTEVCAPALLRLHSLEDAEHLGALMHGAGIALPFQTGQSTGQEPVVLCLRPNEWLLFSESQPATRLQQQLLAAVNMTETAVLDQSDAFAVFRLSGPGAPWLLGKLSGLDYTAARHQGQHGTRTRVARAAVVILYHQTEGERFSFDLIFDRSIAKYLWDLLIASASHADELAMTFGATR